jgi:hypothetical protein
MTITHIQSTIAVFYDVEKIESAKKLLHDLCVKLLDDNEVPRINIRKLSDHKRKLDAEELL